jgi:DNA processing protein
MPENPPAETLRRRPAPSAPGDGGASREDGAAAVTRAGPPPATAAPRRPADRDLLVALHADRDTGPAAACRLGAELARWSGPRTPGRALAAALGVPWPDLERARELLPEAARLADAERRRAGAAGGRLVTRFDADYPRPLLDLPLPPPVLAVAGELPAEVVAGGPAVAMVGSRRADAYGLEVAGDLARALAAAGLPVVSGFARGVDAAAHQGALDGGGTTVAVLGCGLDVPYPHGHRRLFRRIAEGGETTGGGESRGAVLSEFPCGIEPKPWHFPVRNRLIAALAWGTVVVRAARRSGSLITARLALDLGREVLAVPGSLYDRLSEGPHRLLADGAAMATSARDVLDALIGPSGATGLLQRLAQQMVLAGVGVGERPEEQLDEGEAGAGGAPGAGTERSGGAEAGAPARGLPAKVLAALPVGRERSPEALAEELGLGVDAVLGALLELELTGWVRRFPGPAYARRSTRG